MKLNDVTSAVMQKGPKPKRNGIVELVRKTMLKRAAKKRRNHATQLVKPVARKKTQRLSANLPNPHPSNPPFSSRLPISALAILAAKIF